MPKQDKNNELKILLEKVSQYRGNLDWEIGKFFGSNLSELDFKLKKDQILFSQSEKLLGKALWKVISLENSIKEQLKRKSKK